MRRSSSLTGLLVLVSAALAGGCSSTPLTRGGGTGGTGDEGTGGHQITSPPIDGLADGGIPCGSAVCGAGAFCCNAGCGVCAPIGSACVSGCPVDGGGAPVPDDAGAVCSDLQAQYATALAAAKSCDPTASGQCMVKAASALSPLRCDTGCGTVFVNDLSALAPIATAWSQACTYDSACPAILCQPPLAGVCNPVDGGGGECQTLQSVGTLF